MRILLVAGGSGGHIYPCLELAKYLKEKGNDIILCGTKNSMEEKIYKDNNFDFYGVKLNRKKFTSFFISTREVAKMYNQFKPNLVILFGNYISASFGIVAVIKKIPIYLHEQNVVYGMANKLLGYKAKRIYLSLPIKDNQFNDKSLLVGNPKSDMVVNKIILPRDKPNILLVMGSLGSKSINEFYKNFIELCNEKYNYHIVIGNRYYKDFVTNCREKYNVKIYPYLENLSSYIKSCDLFISRAGATTISEILTLGVASILIPSPYVKNNHQYKNAKYLFDNGACLIIEEKDLTFNRLNNEIERLMSNYNECLTIQHNARKLAIYNTREKIYQDIEKTYER